MALTPPALHLAWTLPPGGRPPGWLTACADALDTLRAARAGEGDIGFAPPPRATALQTAGPIDELNAGANTEPNVEPTAESNAEPNDEAKAEQNAAPLSLKLHLGRAPLPRPADQAPAWWLTDCRGRALDLRHPLLNDITAGRGIALALWQSGPGGEGWVCVRRIHVDASTHYAQAQPLLPATVARLLWQAGRDRLLGVAPAGPVYPSPRATGTPGQRRAARHAGPNWPRGALLLRGRWRAWLLRQQARWYREEWRIGIIEQPLSALAGSSKLPATHWLPASSDLGYWADPAAQAGSHSRILAEYFDENSGIGHIEQLRLNAEHRITDRHVMPLGQGQHTSFPQVVQFGGRWLGLAETAALRSCELHEIDAQGRWRPLATLIPGVAAADPALFQWQGRYWLACTDIDLGAMDNLCLYYADQPEGPWLPHANNPVKVDVTGARMAGALFWHEGQLYRPAQNCLGNYGAGVMLHRVVHCTPTGFEEEPVRQLDPDPNGPCPHGMHTLNAWGARTLVDGKRHVFSLKLGWLKLRRRLARGNKRSSVGQGEPS